MNSYSKSSRDRNDKIRTVSNNSSSVVKQNVVRSVNQNNTNHVNVVKNKPQESPKVINFEDRLKSIITSVLNEDQEQRKAQQVTQGYYNTSKNCLIFLSHTLISY